MPRLPRIHIDKGLYFVTTISERGNNLFKDELDASQYLEHLAKYRQQYAFKLFAYGLFPTSVNLLIEIAEDTTISQVMHSINSGYTKYFNSRHQRQGHLFQQRFKATLVEKEQYLTAITRHIHLHPAKARLSEKAEDYKWTSYKHYLKQADENGLGVGIAAQEVLKNFSEDPTQQAGLYREYVEVEGKTAKEPLSKKLKSNRILGSKEFVEKVKAELKRQEDKEEKAKKGAWLESRTHKIFMPAGTALVVILLGLMVFIYRSNLGLKTQYEEMLDNKAAEFSQQIKAERKRLTRNIQEKHSADMVSYKAMKKRLEAEKRKNEELKKNITVSLNHKEGE